jgi:hypothetical protein
MKKIKRIEKYPKVINNIDLKVSEDIVIRLDKRYSFTNLLNDAIIHSSKLAETDDYYYFVTKAGISEDDNNISEYVISKIYK